VAILALMLSTDSKRETSRLNVFPFRLLIITGIVVSLRVYNKMLKNNTDKNYVNGYLTFY